jgi:adenylate kinase
MEFPPVLVRRLEEYRTANTDENTVLNYFDELEIHPIPLPVENQTGENLIDSITKKVGKPHNYGPTIEQLEEKRRQAEEVKAKESALAEEERLKREKEESERHAKSVSEWVSKMQMSCLCMAG